MSGIVFCLLPVFPFRASPSFGEGNRGGGALTFRLCSDLTIAPLTPNPSPRGRGGLHLNPARVAASGYPSGSLEGPARGRFERLAISSALGS